MSLLDLENAENWAIRDTQFLPLLLQHFYLNTHQGFNFSSSILAVLIDIPKLANLEFAGYISQRINLPFGPSGSSNAKSKRLWLRQKQLLIFRNLLLLIRSLFDSQSGSIAQASPFGSIRVRNLKQSKFIRPNAG
jgi:hypothetical protein